MEYWDKQEASFDGVLGGYGHVSEPDIAESRKFLLKAMAGPLRQAAARHRKLAAIGELFGAWKALCFRLAAEWALAAMLQFPPAQIPRDLDAFLLGVWAHHAFWRLYLQPLTCNVRAFLSPVLSLSSVGMAGALAG